MTRAGTYQGAAVALGRVAADAVEDAALEHRKRAGHWPIAVRVTIEPDTLRVNTTTLDAVPDRQPPTSNPLDQLYVLSSDFAYRSGHVPR